VEELTGMCYFCFWSHRILHPSFRGLMDLLLLVCQPGGSDRELCLGQLWMEVEGWE
jgi:hypothetical protein